MLINKIIFLDDMFNEKVNFIESI